MKLKSTNIEKITEDALAIAPNVLYTFQSYNQSSAPVSCFSVDCFSSATDRTPVIGNRAMCRMVVMLRGHRAPKGWHIWPTRHYM